jgi:uncharacterized integral membrane protein
VVLPFIAGMLVASFAILFAVQNSAQCTVTLLFFTLHASLALVLCLTFLFGAMLAGLGLLPELWRLGWRPWKKVKKEEAA